jgi:hypothetical protein
MNDTIMSLYENYGSTNRNNPDILEKVQRRYKIQLHARRTTQVSQKSSVEGGIAKGDGG